MDNNSGGGGMQINDKVTCRPDTKVRGCEVAALRDNEIKVKWYPGPQTRWMPRGKVELSSER